MRVALLGGSGFVGGYLIDALLASGHHPALLVRPGSESKVRNIERCSTVFGDIGSLAAIEDTLDRCDAAIYNIGILREIPRRGITFTELQLNGLIRAVDTAKRQGVKRLILMSANGVKEVGTPYQETKFKADEYALRSGLDVTVFRPSVIFGDPRGTAEFASQLYRQMIAPPLPAIAFHSGLRPKSGQIKMSPVFAGDVADAFVSALDGTQTNGSVIQLGGATALTWKQILRRIAAAVDKSDKLILPMPLALMRVAATLFDWLPQFPVTRDQLTMLKEGNVADSVHLQALIGRPAQTFTPENLNYLAAADGNKYAYSRDTR